MIGPDGKQEKKVEVADGPPADLPPPLIAPTVDGSPPSDLPPPFPDGTDQQNPSSNQTNVYNIYNVHNHPEPEDRFTVAPMAVALVCPLLSDRIFALFPRSCLPTRLPLPEIPLLNS